MKLLNLVQLSDNDIILDFFSGSATTAHAVMQLNAENSGHSHRKFILVQLPEPCDEKDESYKAGYKTICDIGKERIRRAGDKLYETLKTSGKDFQHIAKNINTAPRKTFAADCRGFIKQYLQKLPQRGRFGVTSVTPFLLLPVHPEGCTPAHRT